MKKVRTKYTIGRKSVQPNSVNFLRDSHSAIQKVKRYNALLRVAAIEACLLQYMNVLPFVYYGDLHVQLNQSAISTNGCLMDLLLLIRYRCLSLPVNYTSGKRELMQLPPYFKLADFYDQDWGDWSLQHLPLLKNILHRYCPINAKILDLACGTGVLVQKLAHLGYWVMGIDVSPQMIKIAKAKAGSNTYFEVHNMIDFRTDLKFDLVTCTFDALNYLLSNDELRTVLLNVYGILNAGGLFMFDINTEKLFKYLHKGVIHRNVNGEEFIQYRNYDISTKIATTRFLFSDGSSETHQQRAYNIADFKGLLHQTGFQIIHSYGGFQGEPFTEESYRYIGVVRRLIEKKLKNAP